jgi:3-phosphoshikimate 1-carboxyvinyltransferase
MGLFAAKTKVIKPAKGLAGAIQFPGDKSISHRYALLGAIAEGVSEIHFFSTSADCQSTLSCLRQLGVRLERKDNVVTIQGAGLDGLRPASAPLDAGNSGSTMRMLAGILAGQPFRSVLGGDASLSRRPMKRVADPLTQMGARIQWREGGLPPLEIEGGGLRPIRYEMPVASAQVKSAVLLAGLFAEGETEVLEKARTRDHTELALEQMGADIGRHGLAIAVRGRARLDGKKLYVPGDFSSAAFFVVAGLIAPDSNLMLHNVGLNPTRTALLDVLVPMGGQVKVVSLDTINGELIGDLHVETSRLEGGEIAESAVPGLIDELPALAVLGTQTEQGLSFRGAAELRVKESDRLAAVAENLRRMGAAVEEFPDGLRVAGRQKLRGAEIDPHDDHRIAMAFAVAGLVAQGETVIKNSGCVDISFPDFFEMLSRVGSEE